MLFFAPTLNPIMSHNQETKIYVMHLEKKIQSATEKKGIFLKIPGSCPWAIKNIEYEVVLYL